MHLIDPSTAAPFVAESLRTLREEVGPETAVLGFVGCPYTLATYLVEGKTSKEYLEIKKMAFNEPRLLHEILKNLATSIGEYALFQIENGAQLIQIFDSWAGHLSPRDYDEFAAPYQKMVLDKVLRIHFLTIMLCMEDVVTHGLVFYSPLMLSTRACTPS